MLWHLFTNTKSAVAAGYTVMVIMIMTVRVFCCRSGEMILAQSVMAYDRKKQAQLHITTGCLYTFGARLGAAHATAAAKHAEE